MKRAYILIILVALLIPAFLVAGSIKNKDAEENPSPVQAKNNEMIISAESETIPLADGAPESNPSAVASGISVNSNEKVVLDYSNTADGYVMVKYLGQNPKVKTLITGPSGVTYTYNQSLTGNYDVFVLSDGSGSYTIAVYENTSGTSYAKAFSCGISVSLKDEFAPFLRSNKYVNYTSSSKIVTLAADLCKNKTDTNDKIKAVYEYIINNISYDYKLAKTVTSGYIPDLDSVITKKTGICFDYAATMTAMLRSQGIPTKLIFGYTGSTYHAWISTYSKETGWMTASIYFDGKVWKLMDPTFASTGKSSSDIMKYISNEGNYVAKYLY